MFVDRMEELLRGRFAGSGEERVDKTEMKELEDGGRMEKKSGKEVEERSV